MVRFCNNGHTIDNKKLLKCPVCGEKLFSGCPQCQKRWNDCNCPAWPVYLFSFALPQVWWLLQNGLEWPEAVEGFSDKVQTSRGHAANFQSVSDVVAEIGARLKACGDKGRILKHDARHYEHWRELAPDLKDVLFYCSGWKRKGKFSNWLADRKYKKAIKTSPKK